MEHIGNKQQKGHYNAKCQNEDKERWYLVDDKFLKEIEVTRLVSENANNLIYFKIEGGNTDRQNKQKAKHALTQLEGGGSKKQ